MMNMNIFDTLKKLSESQRKPASYIYLDEKDNQIKEIPLSNLDSSASALMKQNPGKEIHDFIFSIIDSK
jgi:hypothetical protein